MFLLIISLLVVLPLVELWFIVQVGQQIGVVPTIALLIVVSAVGTSLVKREGLRVWRQFMGAVRSGQEPTREIVHGACVLAAGVLLLAPGFFSDVAGLLLLLPPVRALFVRVAMRGVGRGTTVIRATYSGPRVDPQGTLQGSGDIIDVEPHEGDEQR